MFKILVVFNLFSLTLASVSDLKSISYEKEIECSVKNVILKTDRTEKDRKFVFWKLKHKKIIVVDQIIDTNGNEIFKKTSVYICSKDACDTRKYRRMKIVSNEIWIFYYNKNPEKGIIKRYDFCGKYLGEKNWDKDFEDY